MDLNDNEKTALRWIVQEFRQNQLPRTFMTANVMEGDNVIISKYNRKVPENITKDVLQELVDKKFLRKISLNEYRITEKAEYAVVNDFKPQRKINYWSCLTPTIVLAICGILIAVIAAVPDWIIFLYPSSTPTSFTPPIIEPTYTHTTMATSTLFSLPTVKPTATTTPVPPSATPVPPTPPDTPTPKTLKSKLEFLGALPWRWEGTYNWYDNRSVKWILVIEEMQGDSFFGQFRTPDFGNNIAKIRAEFFEDLSDIDFVEESRWDYVDGFDSIEGGIWLKFTELEQIQGTKEVAIGSWQYAHLQEDGVMRGIRFGPNESQPRGDFILMQFR